MKNFFIEFIAIFVILFSATKHGFGKFIFPHYYLVTDWVLNTGFEICTCSCHGEVDI